MLDTDTTYQMTPRPSAMGDLRFAGMVAAGLVAGTLGLGALAAPLVGWKDWPSALQSNATTEPVKLASPLRPVDRQRSPRGPEGTQPTPGGQSAINVTGLPGTAAATGTGTGTGTATGLSVLVGGASKYGFSVAVPRLTPLCTDSRDHLGADIQGLQDTNPFHPTGVGSIRMASAVVQAIRPTADA